MSDGRQRFPVVVDTTVVSILWRNDDLAGFYRERTRDRDAVISFQTLEELWFGVSKAGWGDRRKNRFREYLGSYTVIWPTAEMVEICARLRSQREEAGRTLQTADAWIAATALMLDCPVATHNRDFENIPDLTLIKATPE